MTRCGTFDPGAAPFNLNDEDVAWVRDSLATMTLTERLGQLIMPMLLNHSDAEIERMVALGVGGIFLFHAPTDRLRETSNRFQSSSRLPMLVSGDIEFGELAPLDGLTFTNQLGVAATADDVWTERLAIVAARVGRRCGYNWALAPVIDIDFNPHNPVVNSRSFGSSVETVERLGHRYVVAAQRQGIAACAKHWPGDGLDYRDQHLVTSINNLTMDEWHATFGTCYRRAIEAGVKTVMSAHIALPAYPNAGSKPASLSSALNNDLLRGDLGFNGLIVTDATTMAGFGANGAREIIVPLSISNGCDMILFTANPEIDLVYLERAVFDGRLSRERIDEAVSRILALKASLGLHLDRSPPAIVEPDREEEREWELACARASITLVRDEQRLLPLNPRSHRRILLFMEKSRQGPMAPLPALKVGSLLEAKGFEVFHYGPETVVDPALFDVALYVVAEEAALCRRDLRIDWKALHHGTIRSMERYWDALPCAMVSFGNPYHHFDAPNCPTLVNAYSAGSAVQGAAVDAMTGSITFNGTSPVDPLGERLDLFSSSKVGEKR